MERRQRHLEAMMNEQLLRLDLHNSAIKYDRRRLQTVNMGLAEFINVSIKSAETNAKESDKKIAEKRTELAQKEQTRRSEIKELLDGLTSELEEKRAEAEHLEKLSKLLEEQNKKLKQQQEDYSRYEDWIALNKEQDELIQQKNSLMQELMETGPAPWDSQQTSRHTNFGGSPELPKHQWESSQPQRSDPREFQTFFPRVMSHRR